MLFLWILFLELENKDSVETKPCLESCDLMLLDVAKQDILY